MLMKISIILAIYNEEKYIKRCLRSLADQNYKNFEIIAINDGSTDNSFEIIKNLKFQILNLNLFEQKHQGPAVARNSGVKKAKGDILVFVDGDMCFDKGFLEKLIKPVILGKAKGTYSTEEYVANWENVWARCWNYNWNLPSKKRIDFKRKDQLKDFRAILKTEFDKVDGFDDIGYIDTWTLSEKLSYNPKPVKAKYYHYNPSTLKEVFNQAKWVAKRQYKLGPLGKMIAFIRASMPFSILIGIRKTIKYKEPQFIIFKLVYDFGFTIGLLQKKLY